MCCCRLCCLVFVVTKTVGKNGFFSASPLFSIFIDKSCCLIQRLLSLSWCIISFPEYLVPFCFVVLHFCCCFCCCCCCFSSPSPCPTSMMARDILYSLGVSIGVCLRSSVPPLRTVYSYLDPIGSISATV